MREIKFRGKSLQTGEWFYGNLWDLDTKGRTHIGTIHKACLCIDPETVGQFTGIYDKNNKELYEHDLVKCCGILCEVVYNDHIGSFVLLEVLTQNIGNKPIGQMIDMFGLECIGNIYDDFDLLKCTTYN